MGNVTKGRNDDEFKQWKEAIDQKGEDFINSMANDIIEGNADVIKEKIEDVINGVPQGIE